MSGAELRNVINRRFASTYSKASVVGELARLVRHGDTSLRPQKGQYALLEWQEAEATCFLVGEQFPHQLTQAHDGNGTDSV